MVEASDGIDALELLQQESITMDVVVSDIVRHPSQAIPIRPAAPGGAPLHQAAGMRVTGSKR